MNVGIGKVPQHLQVGLERVFHHDLWNVAVTTETSIVAVWLYE